MGFIKVDKASFGMGITEVSVKAALREWNPDIHFDMGSALNLWHPYQKSRQNIFYRGKSITGMDRYNLPEFAVWSQRREMVEVPADEVMPGEIALDTCTDTEITCHKCSNRWRVPTLAPLLMCPGMCGNFGPSSDETLFATRDVPNGLAMVFRQKRDRVILVGWRHTFLRLIKAKIPGITKERLERRFGVDLSPKHIPWQEIDAAHEDTVLNQQVAI